MSDKQIDKRQRERGEIRQTDSWTGRQTKDREREGRSDRQTVRQVDRQKTEREGRSDRQTVRQVDRQKTHRERGGQTVRQVDRQKPDGGGGGGVRQTDS